MVYTQHTIQSYSHIYTVLKRKRTTRGKISLCILYRTNYIRLWNFWMLPKDA